MTAEFDPADLRVTKWMDGTVLHVVDLRTGEIVTEAYKAAHHVDGWFYPEWKEVEPGVWHFIQKGASGWSGEFVGEVFCYGSPDNWRWHCKTDDWRGHETSVELAKLEVEAHFWKEAWHIATGHHR